MTDPDRLVEFYLVWKWMLLISMSAGAGNPMRSRHAEGLAVDISGPYRPLPVYRPLPEVSP